MKQPLFYVERISSSENQNQYLAVILKQHPVFVGHFPECAVVPGVCTMEMIKDCCADLFAEKLEYFHVKECKFLAPILPEEHQKLLVEIVVKSKENFEVIVEVKYKEQKMLKMKALFRNNLNKRML